MYFRLLSSQLNPKLSIIPPRKEETILIQVCTNESTTYVPKSLKWDEISIPEELIIPEPRPPMNITIREISLISETFDGRPLLKFSSFHELSPPTIILDFQVDRSSTSSVSCTNRNPHISGTIDQTPLPKVIYNDTQSDERLASPTFSQMRTPSELNKITIDF